MSRSMHYFRKYSGPILAVGGVLLMILWVGGPYLESIFSQGAVGGGPSGPGPVVVQWSGGSLREADLDYMRMQHNAAVGFLHGIISQTLANGGQPQAPGVEVTPQGQVLSPGIPVDDSDMAMVNTMLLAEKARRAGLTIDNESVKDFLSRLSAFTMREGDWLVIAQAATKDRPMTVSQLFERLQVELLAQQMRLMELSGLTYFIGGSLEPITPPPSQMWEYFLRLHRRAKIEAYPFDVEKYVSKVKDPTAADEPALRALFEKGRDRDPNPAFPEPGFYRPQKAAFAYFKVDFAPFLEEAKKQITEEQIKAEYEKAISQGQFKVLDLPPESDAPAQEGEPKSDTPAEDKPADEKPADDKPADDKPADEKPAEEKPASDAAPAAEDKPAPPSDNPPPAETDEPAPEKPATDEPAADKGSFNLSGLNGVQFVSTQNEEAAEKAADADKPAPADAPPAENDAPAKDEAKPAPADAPANTEAAPADETKPAGDKPASEADAPATTEEKPADKFKPLEEVREEIIERLAMPIAEDARREVIRKLETAVREYGQKYRRYQTALENKSKSAKEPEKLNGAALAMGTPGVEFFTTPLIDRYQAAEYPIGQDAYYFQLQTGQTYGFGDVAFGNDVLLYEPYGLMGRQQNVEYVFWRTEAEAPKTPTFEEARKDVIAAWKRQKAFEIAKQDAEALAKKAASAGSLKEVADESQVLTPPEFSWLDMGSLPFGLSRPQLSPVVGIDYAGLEFMQAVFGLDEGQAGAAPNQPHTRVYTVKVLQLQPKVEELRDRFAESGFFETMMIARGETQQTIMQQSQQLETEFAVSWLQPPKPASQLR